MEVHKTALSDVWLVRLPRYTDHRGYFCELFHEEKWQKATGHSFSCAQINQSWSRQAVLRGLHFQAPPYAQSKLVEVLVGEVLDVAVDLRMGSPTYGQHLSVSLSDKTAQAIFIPKGFAHGFLVCSEIALVQYITDTPYTQQAEQGIRYNDSRLKIAWPGNSAKFILSDKDKALGSFTDTEGVF